MLLAKKQLQTRSGKRIKCKNTLQEFQARFDHLQELQICFAFFVNSSNVNVVGDGCQFRQAFVAHLSAAEMKLTEMQDLALKTLSQCHSTVDFWQQFPEFERPVYDSFLYLARHMVVNVYSLFTMK